MARQAKPIGSVMFVTLFTSVVMTRRRGDPAGDDEGRGDFRCRNNAA